MFDSKNNNFECGSNEELISYLYNELKDSEKINFEDHLVRCHTCADEISSFDFVHTSIQDWKQTNFDVLKTPVFEIDYDSTISVNQIIEDEPNKLSWLDKLNDLFSPLTVKMATGFAGIFIFLGLGWFMFNSASGQKTLIVEENKTKSIQETKTAESVNSESINSEIVENGEENESSTDDVTQNVAIAENSEIESKKTIAIAVNNSSSESVVKSVTRKKNNSIAAKSNIQKAVQKTKENPVVITNQQPVKNEQIPSLVEYAIDTTEDEDEIRLSDIFDEVGSDDK